MQTLKLFAHGMKELISLILYGNVANKIAPESRLLTQSCSNLNHFWLSPKNFITISVVVLDLSKQTE